MNPFGTSFLFKKNYTKGLLLFAFFGQVWGRDWKSAYSWLIRFTKESGTDNRNCAVRTGFSWSTEVWNLKHCRWNLGKVVDQIVYLLRRCQNPGTSSSYPVQTRQDTIDVDCVLGNIIRKPRHEVLNKVQLINCWLGSLFSTGRRTRRSCPLTLPWTHQHF